MEDRSHEIAQRSNDPKTLIERALREAKPVYIEYTDGNGQLTKRTIEPLEWLADYKIKAYCRLRKDEREFVISRIKAISLIEQPLEYNPATRPTQAPSPKVGSPKPSSRSGIEQWRASEPIPAPASVKTAAPIREINPNTLFSQVGNSEQWRQLLSYYRGCLNREYLQDYLINQNERNDYHFFPLAEDEVWRFMARKSSLLFPLAPDQQQPEIVQFIKSKQQEEQLCIGFPALVTSDKQIAPLLFAPCEVAEVEDRLVLQADDYEISYAVLHSLNIDKEEFAAIIAELEGFEFEDLAGKIKAIQNAVLEKLEDIAGKPIRRKETTKSHLQENPIELTAIITPCFFWVSQQSITRALLEELGKIADHPWQSLPQSLKDLFNSSPVAEYPEAIPFLEDTGIYATQVNDDQRRAIRAAHAMPLTVVTGPPGTGKSQLVLNIITNAVLEGKSVLFASRNNSAVDVVVTRMKGEMHFKGVVRTGIRSMRLDAANAMLEALNQAAQSDKKPEDTAFYERYKRQKIAFLNHQDSLNDVRHLRRVLNEKSSCFNDQKQKFPEAIVGKLESLEFSHSQDAIREIRRITNAFIRHCDRIEQRKLRVEQEIYAHITGNRHHHPIIEDIEMYEAEWGAFGDGLRRADYFPTIESLARFIDNWLHLLKATELRIRAEAANREIERVETEIAGLPLTVPISRLESIAQIATEASLQSLANVAAAAQTHIGRVESALVAKVASQQTSLNVGASVKPRQLIAGYVKGVSFRFKDLDQLTAAINEIQTYAGDVHLLQKHWGGLCNSITASIPASICKTLLITDLDFDESVSTITTKATQLLARIESIRAADFSDWFGLRRVSQMKLIQRLFKSLVASLTTLLAQEITSLAACSVTLSQLDYFLGIDYQTHEFLDEQAGLLNTAYADVTGTPLLHIPEARPELKHYVEQVQQEIAGAIRHITEGRQTPVEAGRGEIFSQLSISLDRLNSLLGQFSYQIADRVVQLDAQIKTAETLIQAVGLAKILQQKRQEHTQNEDALAREKDNLSEAIARDFGRLQLRAVPSSELEDVLIKLQDELVQLRLEHQEQARALDTQLATNSSVASLWSAFRAATGPDEYAGWQLDSEISPAILRDFAQGWLELLETTELKSEIDQLRNMVASKGSEDEWARRVADAQAQLASLATERLNTTWLRSVDQLNPTKLQRVREHASLLKEVAKNYDGHIYSQMMSIREEHIHDIIAAFPVWATTNLSISGNLPLRPDLFDMVIIDEASQCDIPSAIPLIFRAKQVVIIGDVMQLRHIATLNDDSHQALAVDHNVATAAYSYTQHSLFDLATRSVGQHPGLLMLKEHYRSHEAIIGFSNHEFYGGQLIIKTNANDRRVPLDVIQNTSGIYWLNTPGQAIHPPGGSAINHNEVNAIKRVLPLVHQYVMELGWTEGTIGVVTPYRGQKAAIQKWTEKQFGQQITVGTAHTFQGDQRDILLFSPVLAPGISDGSVSWLKRTKNLLNVAVTRARTTLIIVGDFDFCMSLSEDNPYRHLAKYVQNIPHALCQSVEELPFQKRGNARSSRR